MKTYKTLGISQYITTCDCCGRSELKSTVIMKEIETEKVVYFGSTCATRNSGIDKKTINSDLKKIHIAEQILKRARIVEAKKEYRKSSEYLNLEIARIKANFKGYTGKEYADDCRIQSDAADNACKIIADKYNVLISSLIY